MLINSWKGFFSIGSSFIGFVIGLAAVSIPFFTEAFEAELFSELPLFISYSDLGLFISSEFGLVVLSDISLFTSLFLSKFSSIKKTIYSIIN